MALPKIRLVTYAWGQSYLDRLLDFALPAALSPGNLPALASVFDCSAVIVTEEKLFDHVRASPAAKALEAVCKLRLVALDDLIAEPWQYGMTLAYALFRGFEDLGPAMTETYILFLNSDFILADGCYARLIDRIRNGERVHLAPSYCAVEQQAIPALKAKKSQGVLTIQPRDMAALILENTHVTVRAKTVNQWLIEFEYTDQFYWKVDPHTLLGHQMPIALIGMRPERQLTDLNTFWDWGIVYEFCPSMKMTPIGDSDDFLMLELRPADTYMTHLRLGRSTPEETARRTKGYITQYQLDNAKFPLVLHSHDLPPDLPAAKTKLKAYVDRVIGQYSAAPVQHRNHAQWIYHKRHFHRRFERKAIWARIAKLNSENSLGYGAELNRLQNSLGKLNALGSPSDGAEIKGPLARLRRIPHRIFRRMLRRSWHPYSAPNHPVRKIIAQVKAGRSHALVLCALDSFLLHELEQFPGSGDHVHLTPASAMEGAIATLPRNVPGFDLCIVEISDLERCAAADLLNAVAGRLGDCRKIVVLWNARDGGPLQFASCDIANCIVTLGSRGAVHYTSSWISSKISKVSDWKGGNWWSRKYKLAKLAFVVTYNTTLLMLGRLFQRVSTSSERIGMPDYCDSIAAEIDLSPDGLPALVLSRQPGSLASKRAAGKIPGGDIAYDQNPRLTKWLTESGLLKEPLVVVDVGAFGGESAHWHSLGDYLRIYGFDAIEESIDDLRRKTVQSTNIRYFCLAIGEADGERQFFVDPGNPTSSSFFRTAERTQVRNVQVRSLDSLFREGIVERADFLKMDVEGFEGNVLRGAEQFISSGVLGIECETSFATSVEYPQSHFGLVHGICLKHGMRLLELNFDRAARPSFFKARASRGVSAAPGERFGAPSTVNVLFCRDPALERDGAAYYEKLPPPPSVDQLLKLLILYELHGLADIAVDTALKSSAQLGQRIDVDRAVDLLCRR